MKNVRASFIGTGKVATHLALALKSKGFLIVEVFGRNMDKAKQLAKKLNSGYTNDITTLKEADIFICALKDDVIEDVLSKADFKNKLVVHTAGSLSLNILNKFSTNTGVFYPLQTFSYNQDVDWEKIPLFIEGNSQENTDMLYNLASTLSCNVNIATSEQREKLHIAAVFVNNFVNHMYVIGSNLVQESNFSFDVLLPLINETAQKVNNISPIYAQTGPAVRYDSNVIDQHLTLLKTDLKAQELYRLISDNIYAHRI